MLKNILQYILKLLARAIIKKYQPDMIGITGSVGKTSAKEAIDAVLREKFKIRSSIKNYNNELGLPLTIIGATAAGKSLAGWLGVIIIAIRLIIFKDPDYPQILVLELGVDKPGDMDYLNQIVRLKLAVITTIGTSHLANFGSADKIRLEKKKILNTLDKKSGYAILNYDNDKVRDLAGQVDYQTITYGFDEGAILKATNFNYSFSGGDELTNLVGISFKIKYQDAYIPVLLHGALSPSSVSAALAGAAVGFAYKMNGIEISQALQKFTGPKGRMKLIPGFNHSMIIDDTYNASPQSTLAAIDTVARLDLPEIKRRWFVLGDMLELGSDSERGHSEVGQRLAELKNAHLIIMGQEALYISLAARQNGLPETRIDHCSQHDEIIELLKRQLGPGDLVLVKASQGMRFEKIVAGIMANPETASQCLVRQEVSWK